MNGYEVIGVTSVLSFNNPLVNKKYVDDEIISSQTRADGRYVRKTKTTIGREWLDVFSDDVNFLDYNWSRYIKKDVLNSDSNIETRVASFVTDMSLSQLLKHKLFIGARYVTSSSAATKHLVTIPLS
jgi:acetylglutamate synthase